MGFLHNESTGTIQILVQAGDKSWYTPGWDISWHLKPFDDSDTTFSPTGISWAVFKLTVKGTAWISKSDKIIFDGITYFVQDFRVYPWITFNTTKILLSTD